MSFYIEKVREREKKKESKKEWDDYGEIWELINLFSTNSLH